MHVSAPGNRFSPQIAPFRLPEAPRSALPTFGTKPPTDQFIRRNPASEPGSLIPFSTPGSRPRRNYVRTLSFQGLQPGRFKVLAVVDDFEDKRHALFSVNKDGKLQPAGLVSHGEMVEAYAKLVHPRLEIKRYQVQKTERPGQANIIPALQAVYRDIRDGEAIDAVNVSFAIPVPFQRLKEDLSLPTLTPDNVKHFRRAIQRRLHMLKPEKVADPGIRELLGENWDRTVKTVKTQLHVLKELGKRVPVYLPAGNHGPDVFNLLSLAPHVITVGALSPSGKRARYSGNNSLVSQWETVGYPVIPKMYGKRLRGFGFKVPLKPESIRQISFPAHAVLFPDRELRKHWGVLPLQNRQMHAPYGTSFAAPQAAAKAATTGKRLNLA